MVSSNALTDTTSRSDFHLLRPNGSEVTFSFKTDPTRPGITRLTVPKGSSWSTDPHWHESYTEYLHVIQGRVKVIINGTSKNVTHADGPQIVEKFAIHEWMRADRDADDKDTEDVIVEEWTNPSDGIKQVFFRNLLSLMEDRQRYWRSWTMLQVVLILSVYDNYPVLTPASVPYWLTYSVAHGAFALNGLVAKVLGLRPWCDAYTPVGLRAIAAEVYSGKRGTKTE